MQQKIEELKKLALQGDADAQYELGTILIDDAETYMEGIKWIDMAANQGHELAQNFENDIIDDDGRFDAWA